jgi:hypothetical protein
VNYSPEQERKAISNKKYTSFYRFNINNIYLMYGQWVFLQHTTNFPQTTPP